MTNIPYPCTYCGVYSSHDVIVGPCRACGKCIDRVQRVEYLNPYQTRVTDKDGTVHEYEDNA
jgi:hypothetical protein